MQAHFGFRPIDPRLQDLLMTLPDGFTDIPPGKIAAIATILECRTPPSGEPAPAAGPNWRFERVAKPDLASYVALLRRVGTAHLWYQRLSLGDAAIAAKIADEATVIHVLFDGERPMGLAELDLSEPGSAELVYFGVVSDLVGTGAARFMMNRLLRFAFGLDIDRLWLHTNTIDHPKAMGFYRRAGFSPVRQMLELADDPRLLGLFDRDAAPQVPIFEPNSRD